MIVFDLIVRDFIVYPYKYFYRYILAYAKCFINTYLEKSIAKTPEMIKSVKKYYKI